MGPLEKGKNWTITFVYENPNFPRAADSASTVGKIGFEGVLSISSGGAELDSNNNRAKVSVEFSAPPVLVGLADYHNHQFADRAFGGQLFTHGVDPTERCRSPLQYSDNSFKIKDMVRQGLAKEATDQAKRGECAPTPTNLAGQQVDTDSLERAWRGGLRLIVMFAVNSEILCTLTAIPNCTDGEAIDKQLQAAKDLEAEIDQKAGGNGLGWYRIVLSPVEARRVIQQGKLAVVLGVETSNAFGCWFKRAGEVPGVSPLPSLSGLELNVKEPKFALACEDEELDGATQALALARFEYYWSLGVRHVFPVHNVDGLAGGTGLSIPLLHAINNPSRMQPGRPFNKVAEIERVVTQVRPPIAARPCGRNFEFDKGRCNQVALTAPGKSLLKMMADYGVMIDTDHLSLLAKAEALSNDEGLGPYPFVASHAGMNAINHHDKRNEGQLIPQHLAGMIKYNGAFALILNQGSRDEIDTYPTDATVVGDDRCGGTTENFIQSYRYLVETLKNSQDYRGTPSFLGVGLGTDFNGLAGWPLPRFYQRVYAGSTIGDVITAAFIGGTFYKGGFCYSSSAQKPQVSYPFTLNGKSFDRSVLTWSGRSTPYDISYDGVAHVGMLPDFIQELKVLGITDQELAPLWHGAEAYIRTWENASGFAGSYSPEHAAGNRKLCSDLRTVLLDRVADTEFTWRTDWDATRARWSPAIDSLRINKCHGFTSR